MNNQEVNSPKILVKSEWILREMSRWVARGRKQSHSVWSAACHSESLKLPEFKEENIPPSSFLHKPLERKPSTKTASLLWAAAHQHSSEEEHKMRDQRTGRWVLRQTCYDTLAVTVSSAQHFVGFFLIENKTDNQTNISSCELIDCS